MKILATVVLIACLALAARTRAAEPIDGTTPIHINGMGPALIGMQLSEAEKLIGMRFTDPSEDNISNDSNDCAYVDLIGGPTHLAFMVHHSMIVRIDVYEGATNATAEGIGIGSLETEIRRVYGRSKIEVAPSFYRGADSGHDITVTIPGGENQNLRYFFETNLKTVTAIRVGRLPEVQYVEGCL